MNTYNVAAKHEQLCLGIPVWGARMEDDLIVAGMNGLFETKKASGKKLFRQAWSPLGWEPAECVFMLDFLPLPPSQQVTSCSSTSSFVQSDISVFKQWRTITGKGSRRSHRHHFSAHFHLLYTDLCLNSNPSFTANRKMLKTLVQTVYHWHENKTKQHIVQTWTKCFELIVEMLNYSSVVSSSCWR